MKTSHITENRFIFSKRIVSLVTLLSFVFGPTFAPIDALAFELDINLAPSAPAVDFPDEAIIGDSVMFSAVSEDSENDEISYGFDWDSDGLIDEYTNNVGSGVSGSASFEFDTAGDYHVGVYAKDVWNAISDVTFADITIVEGRDDEPPVHINVAPNQPSLSGPLEAFTGDSVQFTVSATDSESDDVAYGFDWNDDGLIDEWTTFVNSGISKDVSHTFSTAEQHDFSVYAKDTWNAISNAKSHSITIADHDEPPVAINLSPSKPTVNAPLTGTVGEMILFSVSSTDPEGDTIAYGFDWNDDGLIDEYTNFVASAVVAQMSHTFSLSDTYTIDVYAKDEWNALSDARSHIISISDDEPPVHINVAPNQPSVSAPSNSFTGDSVQFTASATDPESDDVAYGFDWNNDGLIDEWTSFGASGISKDVFHTWDTAGQYVFSVYAKDTWNAISNAKSHNITIINGDDGGGDDEPPVHINVAPNQPSVSAPSNSFTGDSVQFTASATDPESDDVAYGFDWNNDGLIDHWTTFGDSGISKDVSHTFSPAGQYIVSVYAKDTWNAISVAKTHNITVSDKSNGGGDDEPPVHINLAPSKPLVDAPSTGIADSLITFSVSSVDPENDTIAYGFDWNNDGLIDEYTNFIASADEALMSHSFSTAGIYTIDVYAKDEWNAISDARSHSITISLGEPPVHINVAPNQPSLSGPSQGFVGDSKQFTVSSTDPEGDNVTYGFDWNNDGLIDHWTIFGDSGISKDVSHTFSPAGQYVVSVYAKDTWNAISVAKTHNITVSDKSNGGGDDEPPVHINVAPNQPSVSAPSNSFTGDSVQFTASATDPESDDVAYGFDWNNDGLIDHWTTFGDSGISKDVSHTFSPAGQYIVSVYAKDTWNAISVAKTHNITVSDKSNGGGDDDEPPVHINVAPTAPSITGPALGTTTISYSFTVNSTDSDGDNILYGFDWDNDGVFEEWSDALPSGTSVTRSHTFGSEGTKTFNVVAKDIFNAESSVSSHTIVIKEKVTDVPPDGNGGGNNGGGNNLPIAHDDATTTTKNISVLIDVLDNDSDSDGDALVIFATTTPTHGSIVSEGNKIRYAPDLDFVGTDTFNYSIEDGHNGTNSATVTVTVNNDGGNGGGGGDDDDDATTPVSITLEAFPNPIAHLGTTTLSWSATGTVATCSARDGWTGEKGVSGSEIVGPLSNTTTFTLVCNGDGGTATSTISVTVITDNGNGGGGDFEESDNNSGGSSRRGGGRRSTNTSSGAVLVAPLVLGATTMDLCPLGPYLTQYLRRGHENSSFEVMKLQFFLRDYEGFSNVSLTGEFDGVTEMAVNEFQLRYEEEILGPWGIDYPTGYVYIYTTKKINEIVCGKAFPIGAVIGAKYENNSSLSKDDGPMIGLISATSTATTTGGFGTNFAAAFVGIGMSGGMLLYLLLIFALLSIGTVLIVRGVRLESRGDTKKKAQDNFLNGGTALLVASVLNIVNTLSFIMSFRNTSGGSISGAYIGYYAITILDGVNILSLAIISGAYIVSVLKRRKALKKL